MLVAMTALLQRVLFRQLLIIIVYASMRWTGFVWQVSNLMKFFIELFCQISWKPGKRTHELT